MRVNEFAGLIAREREQGYEVLSVRMNPADVSDLQYELSTSTYAVATDGPLSDFPKGAVMVLMGVPVFQDKNVSRGGLGVVVA